MKKLEITGEYSFVRKAPWFSMDFDSGGSMEMWNDEPVLDEHGTFAAEKAGEAPLLTLEREQAEGLMHLLDFELSPGEVVHSVITWGVADETVAYDKEDDTTSA